MSTLNLSTGYGPAKSLISLVLYLGKDTTLADIVNMNITHEGAPFRVDTYDLTTSESSAIPVPKYATMLAIVFPGTTDAITGEFTPTMTAADTLQVRETSGVSSYAHGCIGVPLLGITPTLADGAHNIYLKASAAINNIQLVWL